MCSCSSGSYDLNMSPLSCPLPTMIASESGSRRGRPIAIGRAWQQAMKIDSSLNSEEDQQEVSGAGTEEALAPQTCHMKVCLLCKSTMPMSQTFRAQQAKTTFSHRLDSVAVWQNGRDQRPQAIVAMDHLIKSGFGRCRTKEDVPSSQHENESCSMS